MRAAYFFLKKGYVAVLFAYIYSHVWSYRILVIIVMAKYKRQKIKSTKNDANAKDILPDRSTTSKLLRKNEEKIHSVNSFTNVHMRLQLRTSVD